MKTESSKNDAIMLPRTNFSGYVGQATTFSRLLITACCFVVWRRLALYLVSAWLLVMRTCGLRWIQSFHVDSWGFMWQLPLMITSIEKNAEIKLHNRPVGRYQCRRDSRSLCWRPAERDRGPKTASRKKPSAEYAVSLRRPRTECERSTGWCHGLSGPILMCWDPGYTAPSHRMNKRCHVLQHRTPHLHDLITDSIM